MKRYPLSQNNLFFHFFFQIGDLYDKFTNDHDYFDSEVYTDRIHHRHVLEDLLQEYQDSHVPAGGSDNENEQDSASDDDDAPDDENASDDDNDLADQLTDIRV